MSNFIDLLDNAICELITPQCLICQGLCSKNICSTCGKFDRCRFRCNSCGREMGSVTGICEHCPPVPRALTAVQSVFWLNESAKKIIHRIKFSREPVWLDIFMSAMEIDGRLISEKPTLVPVPMHWTRVFVRTFNQSALLAKKLARISGLSYSCGLAKLRRTRPQSRSDVKGRQRNLRHAFRWRNGVPPPENVILIDDIVTTGATLYHCAVALRRAGVKNVSAWTLFRTKLKNSDS